MSKLETIRIPSSAPRERGMTLIETLVVISILGILTSVLLPAFGRARDTALQYTSLSNLRQLSSATVAYASDWSDRQFMMIPDDFCQSQGVLGDCSRYLNEIGCMSHPTLGWTKEGGVHTRWAFWIDEDNLCAERGSCANAILALPYEPTSQHGSFRFINASPFAEYLGGRFYDRVFYAPKDRLKYDRIESMLASPETLLFEHALEWSSYCFSASALFNPDVWDPTRNGRGDGSTEDRAAKPCNSNDGGGPAGLKSPPLSAVVYPELKTHILEHEWLQRAPGDVNPLFAGATTPYFFNQGYASAPCTLFYDGSARMMGVREVVQSDIRLAVQRSKGTGEGCPSLWCADWTGKDYFEGQSYGFPAEETSYHVMTRLGIRGRDTIGEE